MWFRSPPPAKSRSFRVFKAAAFDGTNFDCAGQFKLASVNSIGSMGLLNHRSLPTLLKR